MTHITQEFFLAFSMLQQAYTQNNIYINIIIQLSAPPASHFTIISSSEARVIAV